MLKIAYNLLFHYELFRPTAMIDHFSQMKQIVDKEQINYLILDKDDTIVPLYEFQIKDKKIHDTLTYFNQTGRFVVVVSNSVNKDEHNYPPQIRMNNHQKFFDILLTTRPKPFNGQQIQNLIDTQKKLNPSKPQIDHGKIAMVGDRLLTDILLGNLMGWKTYFVKPIQETTIKKHGIAVYALRQFENFLIRRSNFDKFTSQTSQQVNKKQTKKQQSKKQQVTKQEFKSQKKTP